MEYEEKYNKELERTRKRSRGQIGFFTERLQTWPINLKKVEVAVDAGAYIGWWSIALSRLLSTPPTIYAVEPINHKALTHDVSAFKNIIVVPFGLLDKTEVNPFNGLVTESKIAPPNGKRVHSKVLCLSWLDFIKKYDIKKVDLLKVDIEGSEKLLFKGMEEARVLPKYIELEVHPQHLAGLGGQDLWGHANLWKEFPTLVKNYKFIKHYKWGSFFEAKSK